MALQEAVRKVSEGIQARVENPDLEEKIDYSQPFRVRIESDCRDTKDKLNSQWGTCLGEFDSGLEEIGINPLIVTESGQKIWGYECWWKTEEEIKEEQRTKNIWNFCWKCDGGFEDYKDRYQPFDEKEIKILAKLYDDEATRKKLIEMYGRSGIIPPSKNRIYFEALGMQAKEGDEASEKLIEHISSILNSVWNSIDSAYEKVSDRVEIKLDELKFLNEAERRKKRGGEIIEELLCKNSLVGRFVRREIGEREYSQLGDGTHAIYSFEPQNL